MPWIPPKPPPASSSGLLDFSVSRFVIRRRIFRWEHKRKCRLAPFVRIEESEANVGARLDGLIIELATVVDAIQAHRINNEAAAPLLETQWLLIKWIQRNRFQIDWYQLGQLFGPAPLRQTKSLGGHSCNGGAESGFGS